jgi:hypothetical protein
VNLITLTVPIAVATVISAFAFAGAWRATKMEKRTGAAPWYLSAGIVAYGLPLAAFLYFARSRTLTSGLDVLAAALAAQAIGAAIVYVITREVITARSQSWRERIPMICIGAFLLCVAVGGVLRL